MSLAEPSEIDHGTTRLAPGIAQENLSLAANVTVVKSLSAQTLSGAFAAGLGNGALAIVGSQTAVVPELEPHTAAVTGLVASSEDLFSIGQDGKLFCHNLNSGARSLLFSTRREWLYSLQRDPKTGCVACANGKTVTVLPTASSGSSAQDHQFTDNPSSVSGLAFSPDGTRIAASHYDGVTLWALDGSGKGEILRWKGFHIGVSWSPDGRFVVSATQERELHVWDLVTGKDFRLGGYPSKTHMLKWTNPAAGPTRLVCSGADVVTAWPFGDVGPGSLPPVEIGYVYSGRVTAVSPHPTQPIVAGGYTTGTVLVGGLQKGEAAFARIADGQEISALDWSSDGHVLAAGTRDGSLDLISIKSLNVK